MVGQSFASTYKDSISFLYFSLMIFRFSFNVGVSYPPSIENSKGKIVKLTTFWALEMALELAISRPSWMIFLKAGHPIASWTVFAFDPLALM